MTAVQTLLPPRTRRAIGATWAPYAALAVGIVALLLLFHAEATAAVHVWLGSTAYNHAFLIIPIAAYLVWDRRADLAGFAPRPMPMLALLAIPIAFAWFAAERIGFIEGRQLVAMTGIELLFLCVLGPRGFWRLLGPLLYLYFLVPFGNALTPWLQHFTTAFVMHGLDLLGIPNFTDGTTIQIPEGTFVIAEACAGLRFLIAAVAFGCLYALLIYRSPLRRLVFIGVSIVVPVIANGLRALGIVTLGHLLGSAKAAETDHILYGWIFFSIVLLILIVLGLPFRQDQRRRRDGAPRAPLLEGPSPAGRAALAALVTVVLLCVGPAAAEALNRLAVPPTEGFHLAAQLPCTMVGAPASPLGAFGRMDAAVYRCGGGAVMVRSIVFSARTPPRPILETRKRLAGLGIEDARLGSAKAQGLRWLVVGAAKPPMLTASLLWADGHAIGSGLGFRLRRGWRSIVGGGAPVILVVASPVRHTRAMTFETERQLEASLATFLKTQTGVPAALARAAAAAK